MKTLKTPQLRLLVLAISLTTLPGCLFPEDKGTIENVGTPVAGEGNFTVSPPVAGPTEPTIPTLPPEPPPAVPPAGGSEGPDFSFSIDNGAVYSHAEALNLSISTNLPTFLFYKISSNALCDGGTWARLDDSLSAQVSVTNFNRNAKNNYSVQFRDVDATPGDCLKASIIHDNQGPEILFSKYPMASLEEGATAEIIAEVKDVSPIASVECMMNAISKPCLAGTNIIQLSQLPAGDYKFTVNATDVHGYKSSKSVSWTVVNKAKMLTQTLLVRDDRKVDVLIVIDNSGSMQYEQQSMGNRVKNMLNVLNGLDYRIAITTTDPDSTHTSNKIKYYGDGDLIPLVGPAAGKMWIDSSMDMTVAQQSLSQTLQRPETGSGVEQGIRAAYRFVEKATTLVNGAPAIPFFRDGANFATLIISDEDESANTTKNDPANLLKLISSTFNNQKAFSWHSIITKPGDLNCARTYGATYGERYKTLSDLTGGIIGSVCEADYAAQVSGIATEIRNLVKNITLTCAPLSTVQIKVTKDGTPYTVPYVVEGLNMKFSTALEPGEYKVDYACLK